MFLIEKFSKLGMEIFAKWELEIFNWCHNNQNVNGLLRLVGATIIPLHKGLDHLLALKIATN